MDATPLYALQNVSILSNGFMTRHGRLFLGYYYGFVSPTLWRSRVKAALVGHYLRYRSRAIRFEGDLLYFADAGSCGFFHWFGDALQKLEALQQWRPELMLKAFVPHDAPAFVRATLGAYDLETVVPGRFERLDCDSVTVLPRVASSGNFRPGLMKAMRARLRTHFGVEDAPSRRIYISREDAPRRRVVNEAEIGPILKDHGVEFVSMAGLPYAEQVEMVASADLVVGLHGAGLTHMVLMKPGTRVLELRARGDAHNNCYFSLASALGIEYSYLQCDPVDPKRGTHAGDFLVDLVRLDEELGG